MLFIIIKSKLAELNLKLHDLLSISNSAHVFKRAPTETYSRCFLFIFGAPLGVSGWKGRVRNKARGGGMYVLCHWGDGCGGRIYFDDNVAHFF